MTARIHPTAIVDPQARIGADVEVGPYSIITGPVEIGDRVRLHSHVVVNGRTKIGPDTVVYPFASLGHQPQDLKYKGEPSTLVIGARNQIREHVTMNPGTSGGGMTTEVGDDCLFMVGAHVAHDCRIGNRVILANNATLAGHVVVGEHAIIGGLAAVRQYVRIGAHAMIGGMSGVENDVIPYGLVMGERAKLAGLNVIGLERHGFGRENIHALRQAYRQIFFGDGTFADRLSAAARGYANDPTVMAMVGFIRDRAANALCQPRETGHDGANQ